MLSGGRGEIICRLAESLCHHGTTDELDGFWIEKSDIVVARGESPCSYDGHSGRVTVNRNNNSSISYVESSRADEALHPYTALSTMECSCSPKALSNRLTGSVEYRSRDSENSTKNGPMIITMEEKFVVAQMPLEDTGDLETSISLAILVGAPIMITENTHDTVRLQFPCTESPMHIRVIIQRFSFHARHAKMLPSRI